MQERRRSNEGAEFAGEAKAGRDDPGAPGFVSQRKEAAAAKRSWFREPKAAVWLLFALAVVVGGGRRLLLSYRARKAAALLENPDVTPEQIEAVADHGRAGVYELLRIFGAPESTEERRHASGRALSKLWRDDQLIAEEEQAIVRRGFSVNWHARRRYPRGLRIEIPIRVSYRVPFLIDDDEHVGPGNLEWSHRVVGGGRAALETYSAWTAGDGRVAFSVFPGDYATNGPHRIVLQSRVRTTGLTECWQIELPHVAFSFEFDPILELDAICTVRDATRDEAIARAVGLERALERDGAAPTFLSLSEQWAIRNPPELTVVLPMASDFAHSVWIELEGCVERVAAGRLILGGPGGSKTATSRIERVGLGPVETIPRDAIERPGSRRLRVHLVADTQLGWADPDTRSLWPGGTVTDWVEAEIVRR